jgi:hypothetical protein
VQADGEVNRSANDGLERNGAGPFGKSFYLHALLFIEAFSNGDFMDHGLSASID